MNCHKQNTPDDTDPNEQIPHKKASEKQNASVEANTNKHSPQSPDIQSTSSSSSSSKPSGSTPNVTNPVKIAKFSGNFVNGGGPVHVEYVNNVMNLKVYLQLVFILFIYFLV